MQKGKSNSFLNKAVADDLSGFPTQKIASRHIQSCLFKFD
jgi:hypothetical protein